jgi:hypothetical protein
VAEECFVRSIEHGTTRLSVEPEHAPHLTGARSQSRDQLLIAAERHVAVPSWAPVRVSTRRLVQRGDARVRHRDLGELVHVLAVVLVSQPARGKLRQAVLVVTGDQERRGIKGVPARRPVMPYDSTEHIRGRAPQTRQIGCGARNLDDFRSCSFATVVAHNHTVRARCPPAHTTFVECRR